MRNDSPRGIFLSVTAVTLLVILAHLVLMSSGAHAASMAAGATAMPAAAAAHGGEHHGGTPETPSDDAGCDVVMPVVAVQSPGDIGDVGTPRMASEWLVLLNTPMAAPSSGPERADPFVLHRAVLQIYRV